jgi:hypothetical protein
VCSFVLSRVRRSAELVDPLGHGSNRSGRELPWHTVMDLSGEFISRVDHHRATSNHLAPWTFPLLPKSCDRGRHAIGSANEIEGRQTGAPMATRHQSSGRCDVAPRLAVLRIADQAIERVTAKVMLRSRRDKPVKGL